MSFTHPHLALRSASAADRDAVPLAAPAELRDALAAGLHHGLRAAAYFGTPRPEGDVELLAVLADDHEHCLRLLRCVVTGESFPSVAASCPQVALFEREIAEQTGLVPEGHPWLKPVRFVPSWRAGRDAWGRSEPQAVGVMEYYRVEGEEVHEVAVGPVHAGVIEPGHFRFQCHGEQVFHLEISLGYQHRGVEESLAGAPGSGARAGPDKRSLHTIETLAGDTTIGHATAYSQVVEALAGVAPGARAESWRGIALEIERLANHCGDLGALSGDIGFLPTAAYCGRIRGDYLNMTALVCGNRFGRSLVRPGGTTFDGDAALLAELDHRLAVAAKDTRVAVELLWDTPSVMARFEETGPVPALTARELGLVGPAARASGLTVDVRHDHPTGVYARSRPALVTRTTGDVYARAYLRREEIVASIDWVRAQVAAMAVAEPAPVVGALAGGRIAVSLVEGWRGEICHVALTGGDGRFQRYKVVDPSFHNWSGLAFAMRNQQISDFPLCNKSFNLSYCGHDL